MNSSMPEQCPTCGSVLKDRPDPKFVDVEFLVDWTEGTPKGSVRKLRDWYAEMQAARGVVKIMEPVTSYHADGSPV